MTPDYYVKYAGKKYPAFRLNITDQSDENSSNNMEVIEVTVSTESLERVLIGRAGLPVSSEAALIDEEIFFYIPDDMVDNPSDVIADFVSDNCW